MLECLIGIWNRRKILLIVVLFQVMMNIIGQSMADSVQTALMVSSGIVLVGISIYGVCLQRKNILGFLLNIVLLYFNYSLAASVYWNGGRLDPWFKNYLWSDYLRCINVVLVFYAAYLCVLNEKLQINKQVFTIKYEANYLVVFGCAAYIALAPFLFYYTDTFGVRGYFSAPYEYSLVVLIAALRFSGRRVKPLAILMTASAWLIIHGLLHGERVLALQMVIVWGLYLGMQWLSIKWIVPAGIVGIFVLTIFGRYRGLSAMEGNILQNVYNVLLQDKLANDTSFAAFQSGMNILKLADITPLLERIFLFLKYLLYIVAGSAVPDVNLTILALEVGNHGGGGWLPFYTHFWLGYPGVILSGGILAWLINRMTALTENRYFLNFTALYVIATSPRWYLYSPSPLTRGMLIFAAFYFVAYIGDKWSLHIWHWLKNQRKDKGNPHEPSAD